MRTKTLLLTAALSAAGLANTMAQVYSVNAVGYYNITVNPGKLELIANQLNTGANTLDQVLPGPYTDGTLLYKFDALATPAYQSWEFFTGIGWFDGSGNSIPATLNPGEAAFIGPGPLTLTFVGEVPQGTLNTTIPAGLSLRSSQVPQQGTFTAGGEVLGLGIDATEGTDGDLVYVFDQDSGSYASAEYFVGIGFFAAPDITLPVGHGVFFNYASQKTWTRTFSVNP